jgi:hypothetical protein
MLTIGSWKTKNGGQLNRDQIEESKRRIVREREFERSPARVYWRALVARVHSSESSFRSLRREEQTYFALRLLILEVYNGGFYQLFANSTGSLYAHMVDGLMELEAHRSLTLLTRAKEVLLGAGPVPTDREGIAALLPDIELFEKVMKTRAAELDAIEKEFWSDPEQLDERCTQYALANGLYAAA